MNTKIKKAVIPVAGLGTRFLPATKVIPKELLPIVDKPSVQYIVEEAVASGIEEIILVTGRGKQSIMDYFDYAPELENILEKREKFDLLNQIKKPAELANFFTVWQSRPLGLGHAILCAEDVVGDEPFLVCLPDEVLDAENPSSKELIDAYAKYKSSIIGLQQVEKERVNLYGIVAALPVTDRCFEITNLIEKPNAEEAPSNLSIVGRYVLNPKIFKCLRRVTPGINGEIQLTDALNLLLKKEKIYGQEISGTRYDTGDKLGFLKANLAFGLKREEFREELKNFVQNLGRSL
ncbi:MAG: UTP--glucose-1-phosphate uridylyltransferase GalU [Deltaproteobacteria bacterium]|nr:UTP--glucose-1-phosphate uridylyltransferase GalU [Deltaproteobacteria bacterium]